MGVALVLLLMTAGSLAAFPDAFTLTWWTADGGGNDMSGGSLSLSGTAGQPDTGQMSGGGLSLGGGFWTPFVPDSPTGHQILLPMIRRGP